MVAALFCPRFLSLHCLSSLAYPFLLDSFSLLLNLVSSFMLAVKHDRAPSYILVGSCGWAVS